MARQYFKSIGPSIGNGTNLLGAKHTKISSFAGHGNRVLHTVQVVAVILIKTFQGDPRKFIGPPFQTSNQVIGTYICQFIEFILHHPVRIPVTKNGIGRLLVKASCAEIHPPFGGKLPGS